MTISESKDFFKEIGLDIKLLRVEGGFSQKKFANMIGITQSHLSKIERGKVNLQIDLLIKIANSLDKNLFVRISNDDECLNCKSYSSGSSNKRIVFRENIT